MSPSKIFLYFCLSFIFGTFLGSIIKISQPLMLGILILGLILISVFLKYKKTAVVGFCILFLAGGIWRYQQAEIQISKSKLQIYKNQGKNITLIGTVSKEPVRGEKITKLTVKTEKITNGEKSYRFQEKVLITTYHYPEYKYGDKLKIVGKLESPEELDGFNYPGYLAKEGIYSIMSWPEMELGGGGAGNPLIAVLSSFKNKFKQMTGRFISPPQQGILEALIFGDESGLSKEWKEKLNLTGTRHIAAVSGMNITILSSLILSFLLSFGLWRQQAFYLSLFLLLLYILMIGAPASAVRAGIMASFLMTAQYLGRMNSASRTVVFAATLMLIQNPFLLTLDVGFQLSFLAILGIIYFQPFFSEKFSRIPNPKLFPLKTTLATTIAAQIFTLPILVYNFGNVPLLSPLTNVLIVPFLAPLTILIFIFGLLAILIWPLGFLISLPVWLSLTYIVKIVDYASQISFSSLTIKNIHWAWIVISYLLLTFFVLRLKEREKLKFLRY